MKKSCVFPAGRLSITRGVPALAHSTIAARVGAVLGLGTCFPLSRVESDTTTTPPRAPSLIRRHIFLNSCRIPV